MVAVTIRHLACSCGSDSFHVVHNDAPTNYATSIYTVGVVCSVCEKRSLLIWQMDPAPDPAGGMRWSP